jgi:hypothetical protein
MAGVTRVCPGRKPDLINTTYTIKVVKKLTSNYPDSIFMNITISDFTAAQQEYVTKLLAQRYSKQVELQLADSELQLDLESEELTVCPTLYWSERGAQFVVYKIGEERYRCQFFYSATEQFGTGHDEYDDIEKCVVTVLQVQSDHERQLSKLSSAATTIASVEGDDYHGPLVI